MKATTLVKWCASAVKTKKSLKSTFTIPKSYSTADTKDKITLDAVRLRYRSLLVTVMKAKYLK